LCAATSRRATPTTRAARRSRGPRCPRGSATTAAAARIRYTQMLRSVPARASQRTRMSTLRSQDHCAFIGMLIAHCASFAQ
jgi:hypothetical protein